VVAFRITEGMEEGLLPELHGFMPVEDLETGETAFVSWKNFQKTLQAREARFLDGDWKTFKSRCDVCPIRADEDTLPTLVRFFQRTKGRR
jgi:hypothetical protein